MRILDVRTFSGPNVYHHKPMLVIELDLEELAHSTTAEQPKFVERLLALLPGLQAHHCSKGRPGGFVERMQEGTYFGHVVEHVALELEGLAGSHVTHGKTRAAGTPGVYNVAVRFKSEHGMTHLLEQAVELVQTLLSGHTFDVSGTLAEYRAISADKDLGPSTAAIVDAAARRGIPWRRLDDGNLVQLGYGRHRRLIEAAVTDATSLIAVDTVGDKVRTKELLHEAGVPVPRGGVVVVEEGLRGRDYRLLVVNGELIAASERKPCEVVGDGEATVRELIVALNQDPLRGEDHELPLTKVKVDEELSEYLARSGLDLDHVPAEGESVRLRANANLSAGATAVDVTDLVHPATQRACERAAALVGLDICGVDLITSDIGEELDGGILELNASPGLRMHVAPSQGASRDVGGAIVAGLFPPGSQARVPICAVTGTNGKTTVTRLVSHLVSLQGLQVGMTSTDGIHIGADQVRRGDLSGAASARSVLADATVEVAVLETARGGILRRGLGYDWADVGVITNITPDHLGQDGVDTVDDLVWIKSLVAERVKDGGVLVLNAQDPGCLQVAREERVDVGRLQLVMFATDPSADAMAEHLLAGGAGYFVRDGWLVECSAGVEYTITRLEEVPLTMGGRARFQVENVLAAAAAARALGVTREQVATGLATFGQVHNSGRANLYAHGRGFVFVDYGHNEAALRAAGELLATWDGPLVGVVGAPGDRTDELIKNAAHAAAGAFPRVVLREDSDLRGRAPGEVAGIMRAAIEACARESRGGAERDAGPAGPTGRGRRRRAGGGVLRGTGRDSGVAGVRRGAASGQPAASPPPGVGGAQCAAYSASQLQVHVGTELLELSYRTHPAGVRRQLLCARLRAAPSGFETACRAAAQARLSSSSSASRVASGASAKRATSSPLALRTVFRTA